MDEKILHLVVRFSDNLFSIGDVVEKHNQVVARYGYVWFGKFGSTIAEKRIQILNAQIGQRTPTYIYLVKGNRRKSTFYLSNLLEITRKLSQREEKCFPEYYAEYELQKYIHTWFKLSAIIPVETRALSKLKAIGSVFSIHETLARSASGYFLVHESNDIF